MSTLRAFLCLLALLSLPWPAFALTFTWDCNKESDMKEYRLERSGDAGASWGVASMIPHPQPCVSPITLQYGAYLAPGTKLFRLFAGDEAGNWSQPSNVVSLTVKPPLIGNPGGQEEAPLPPSPYRAPSPTPVPPPVVPPTPPPSPVLRHDDRRGARRLRRERRRSQEQHFRDDHHAHQRQRDQFSQVHQLLRQRRDRLYGDRLSVIYERSDRRLYTAKRQLMPRCGVGPGRDRLN